MKNNGKNVITMAQIMEKVARKSVVAATDSRCMYIFHQPKQPAGVKKFKK